MAKHIYLIRHAEKDDQGTLTQVGKQQASQLKERMPAFSLVISSESSRTKETAYLVTGTQAIVDPRAGFYMATPQKSDLLNKIAKEDKSTLLVASIKLNDPEVLSGIKAQATKLNELIEETINKMSNDEKVLIVSHDLSISPAMLQRGIPLESIPFLSGYIIDEQGEIQTFNRN